MKNFLYFFCNFLFIFLYATEDITPYKFNDTESKNGLTFNVSIPKNIRHTINRDSMGKSKIIYYFSKPKNKSFPIFIFFQGSSSKDWIVSAIHYHRYFLKELRDERGFGVLSIENYGVDGMNINQDIFMENYTRSARLQDAIKVVDTIKIEKPEKWNGKFIFIGGSEGGLLATTLTEIYSKDTLATINWVGASDWSWRNELWSFIQSFQKEIPWYVKLRGYLPNWMWGSINSVLISKNQHDATMDEIMKTPSKKKEYLGMTYLYHSDALQNYPRTDYSKIKTPFLCVTGTKDSVIESSDSFVEKAKKNKVPITYFRIEGMDHTIRKRTDILEQSFNWLDLILNE